MKNILSTLIKEREEAFDEKFYGETRPRRTAYLMKDSEIGEAFKSFNRDTIRKTLEAVSEQINEIIVQTDWTNNSSVGVDCLSHLTEVLYKMKEV